MDDDSFFGQPRQPTVVIVPMNTGEALAESARRISSELSEPPSFQPHVSCYHPSRYTEVVQAANRAHGHIDIPLDPKALPALGFFPCSHPECVLLVLHANGRRTTGQVAGKCRRAPR